MTVTQIENVKEPVQKPQWQCYINGGRTPHSCQHRQITLNKKTYCCIRFYRMKQMRMSAKQRGRDVPSWELLDNLIDGLDDFRCPTCSRVMTWTKVNGRQKQVVSLQHDSDGRIRLICMACNAGEAGHKHDVDTVQSERRNGNKYCRMCDSFKAQEYFCIDRNNPTGRHGYCRSCVNERDRKRRADGWTRYVSPKSKA